MFEIDVLGFFRVKLICGGSNLQNITNFVAALEIHEFNEECPKNQKTFFSLLWVSRFFYFLDTPSDLSLKSSVVPRPSNKKLEPVKAAKQLKFYKIVALCFLEKNSQL